MTEISNEAPTHVPDALYSCSNDCCRTECSYEPEALYWYAAEKRWVCENCWDELPAINDGEDSPEKGVTLAEHLKSQQVTSLEASAKREAELREVAKELADALVDCRSQHSGELNPRNQHVLKWRQALARYQKLDNRERSVMSTPEPPIANDAAGAHSLHRLVRRLDELEARISKLEPKPTGYRCRLCGQDRPANWFIYEIEQAGSWLRPCCAICARENKSRGPFPLNSQITQPGCLIPTQNTEPKQ